MIHISGKEIEGLDEEKLSAFLSKKCPESRFLDYKLKYDEGVKKDEGAKKKEEFLKDVTAFANLSGGNIIIGVPEDKDAEGKTVPGDLIGVDDGERLKDSYRDLCDANIDPPIRGLVIKLVPLKEGKSAIVIYIPVSLSRPHLVSYNNKSALYIRTNDRVTNMTSDDVKRSVMEVVSIEKNLDSYIEKIEQEMRADFYQDDFTLIMHAAPYLLEDGQVDTSSNEIREILQSNNLMKKYADLVSQARPTPSIHGIYGTDSRTKPTYMTYIHRNGFVGCCLNLKERYDLSDKGKKTIIDPIKEYFSMFFFLCRLVTEKAKIVSPYQLRCNFLNADQAVYCSSSEAFNSGRHSGKVWKRSDLRLPGIRVDSFDDVDVIAGHFFERLRNAFGLEKV